MYKYISLSIKKLMNINISLDFNKNKYFCIKSKFRKRIQISCFYIKTILCINLIKNSSNIK